MGLDMNYRTALNRPHFVARIVGKIHIKILEEDCPTNVGHARNGDRADLRAMRRQENVSEASLAADYQSVMV